MAALDQQALDAIAAPLATVCAKLGFTYSWRVERRATAWIAECAAGFPRVNGRLTGPHPRYRVEAATPEEALSLAVGWLIEHSRSYPFGYSPTPARPPWQIDG